jgi:cob(I)alamin adenosyltransferase
MKIYTKTGDDGQTGLLGGRRVAKDDPRIEAYGTVDELSVALGSARAAGLSPVVNALILEIQGDLFTVGAELASPAASEPSAQRIQQDRVQKLEAAIDRHEEGLESLRHFIMPGGTMAACFLHQARVVCRRAERRVVTLARTQSVSPFVLPYLNRLSDLLFVLSRVSNRSASLTEIPWRGTSVHE